MDGVKIGGNWVAVVTKRADDDVETGGLFSIERAWKYRLERVFSLNVIHIFVCHPR